MNYFWLLYPGNYFLDRGISRCLDMDKLKSSVVSNKRSPIEQISGPGKPKPNTNCKRKPRSIRVVEREKRVMNSQSSRVRSLRSNAKIDKRTAIVHDVAGRVAIVRKLKTTYDESDDEFLRSHSDRENNDIRRTDQNRHDKIHNLPTAQAPKR